MNTEKKNIYERVTAVINQGHRRGRRVLPNALAHIGRIIELADQRQQPKALPRD